MKLYRREDYLQKIRGFYHDTGIIKVITGVRRCGKSCLMETISLELKENGVRDENIIYLNLDKRGFRKIKTADQLDALIEARSAAEGTMLDYHSARPKRSLSPLPIAAGYQSTACP